MSRKLRVPIRRKGTMPGFLGQRRSGSSLLTYHVLAHGNTRCHYSSFIVLFNLTFTNYNSTGLFIQVHNNNSLLKERMIGNIRYYFYNNDLPIQYRAEGRPPSKQVNKLKWTKKVLLGELWEGHR